jgi:membrane fusion protein, multidrug efflux system
MPEQIDDVETTSKPEPNWKERTRKFAREFPLDLVPLLVLVITVFLVILYANEWKLWDGQRASETTNDAYVRADITPLSTKVSGTVARVLINDFDAVKKGQLLVELRDDDFIARCKQAESLYKQSAESIETVQKQIEVQKQRIESARLNTSIGEKDITRATANVGSTIASLRASKSSLEEAKAQEAQAQARLKADEAVELRALQERQRQTDLFAVKASTQQTIEQVVADHDRQKSIVAADRAEISRLNSLIAERTADISRFNEDLKSSQAGDLQSQDQLRSRVAQYLAEKRTMDVLNDQLSEAQSASKAKLAAWQEAKVELDYTKIIAPVDGALSERRVRAGQQVNAGTQVVTIVSSVPWVIASYRETQMRKIGVGDKAEVSVDALGSAVLKGTVQSLSPASEAQFALLPPDNPSGNFTKITQRLPIKIVFNPDQKLVQRVKSGMTVIVTVWPGNHGAGKP